MKYFIKLKTALRNNRLKLFAALIFVPFYLVFGCPSRYLFGVCCPGCGMSRAVWSIAVNFDLASALSYHPLVVLSPIAMVVWLLRNRLPRNLVRALCVFALALLIGTYVVRLVVGSDVVYIDFERSLIYKIFS